MSVIVQKTRTKTIDSHSSHSAQTPWGPQVHEKHKNKVITKMNTRTVTVAPKATTLQEKEEPSWIFHSTRFVAIALPFISRYKPLGNTFSLATGSVRILFSLQQVLSSIQKGDSSAIPLHLANACVATFAVAGTLFAHPIGMLVTTGHDMITEILALGRNIQQANNAKAIENCTQLINDVLYLMVFLSGGSTAATMAYFGTQVLTGAFRSAHEIRKGYYYEGASHALMSLMRAYQLGDEIHNWYMTRPQAPIAPKQPETPVQQKPVAPVAPVATPSEKPVQTKPVAPVAPVAPAATPYKNGLRLDPRVTFQEAFEIAQANPGIEIFNYHGNAIKIPPYYNPVPCA